MTLFDEIKAHAEKRPCVAVQLASILDGYDGDATLALRALTVGDDDGALEATQREIRRVTSGLPEPTVDALVRSDKFAGRMKAERVFQAARDPRDHTKRACPSVETMLRLLPHELERLVSALEEAQTPKPERLTDAVADQLFRDLSTIRETPAADVLLGKLKRETLVDLLIRCAAKVHK